MKPIETIDLCYIPLKYLAKVESTSLVTRQICVHTYLFWYKITHDSPIFLPLTFKIIIISLSLLLISTLSPHSSSPATIYLDPNSSWDSFSFYMCYSTINLLLFHHQTIFLSLSLLTTSGHENILHYTNSVLQVSREAYLLTEFKS